METKPGTGTLMDRCQFADLPVDPTILHEPSGRETVVFEFELNGDTIFGRVDWEGYIVRAYCDTAGLDQSLGWVAG